MDAQLCEKFHWQIYLQCEFALLAWADLEAAITALAAPEPGHEVIKQARDHPEAADWDEVMAVLDRPVTRPQQNTISMLKAWYSIQNLLSAAANISKALWGTKAKLTKQREPLRRSLGITDDSPLYSRDMRNNFEHFDECLDDWWEESHTRSFVDLTMGGIPHPIPEQIVILRNYLPVTGQLVFWEEQFDLRAVVAEVTRILPLAKANSFH